jgi:hypothetical protein
MMLMRRREWRCDFGVRLSNRVIYGYFVDFVNFGCREQALQLVEPVQASSLHFTITTTEANMVKLSSRNTAEVLNSLFLSPTRDSRSPVSNLHKGCSSDVFKEWLESNDMAASVYVLLTADASSSRVPVTNSSRDGHKCTRQPSL